MAEFFGPLVAELNEYLKGLGGSGDVRFNFRLVYFNSSTAKILIGLFDALEGAAKTGVQVRLAWYYDPEDDTMKEFGEELSEELEHAEFELIARGE